MAKKNYTPSPDGKSAEDRALDVFANAMIEKIQNMQEDWKKPWFTAKAAQLPQNLSGRHYNGMNSVILMLMQEKNGWQTSRYATFDRIASLNYTKDKEGNRKPALDAEGNKLPLVSVNKGEKSTPVMLTTFTVVDPETKERIKYDDYKQMTQEERAKYNVYPKLQVYNVFNLDQTNLKESRPEMYQKFLDETEGKRNSSAEGMKDFPALDAMIEKDLYVCPIKPTYGDDAYYSISKDVIVIPEKSQFVDGESFYSNLLHEMSHASGSENRLNRLKPGSSFGSADYSREELVAELTAALVSSQYGMEKHIKTDSAAYLKNWLDALHQSPDFIKTTLMDVKRSSSFISQRLDAVGEKLEKDGWEADFSEIRQQNKTYSPAFDRSHQSHAQQQGQQSEETQQQEKSEQNQQQEEAVARSTEQPRFHR
jgi:antirestriction protein ArdC